MESIRSIIIGQFAERAKMIRIANGYVTDCGENVFVGGKRVDPTNVPFVNVIPLPEESTPKSGLQESVMDISVEGVHFFGPRGGSPAEPAALWGERILADLITCFCDRGWDRRRLVPSPASPATYLPKCDISLVYSEGGVPEYPDPEMVTVSAVATFTVTYLTVLGDPYTLGGQ